MRLTSIARRLPAAVVLFALAACQPAAPQPTRCVWLVGAGEPRFDPDGAPEAVRWSLERLLTRGLVAEDSTGTIRPVAARRFSISPDSLVYTFHLRRDLRFSDGVPCGSEDFRRALVDGLERTDHGTRAWLLSAVRGVERARPGRRLPDLGIEVPDDSTLVLRLSRPDVHLLSGIALPGVSDAWRERSGASWDSATGIGPYRVVSSRPGRELTLARREGEGPEVGPDTLLVHFGIDARRARGWMRLARADLIWPPPPRLLDETLPEGYRHESRPARPTRTLLLVMRPDRRPTSKREARYALSHGIHRGDLHRALGLLGQDLRAWPEGAGNFDFPKLDHQEVLAWLERGRLGRSFHVVMAYDRDGPAAGVAPILQQEWARQSILVELMPARGERLLTEQLRGRAQLLLVDAQGLLGWPDDLVTLAQPRRGPPVGSFSTAWRTRELDRWIEAPGNSLALGQARRTLEEERVVIPIADLPWVWIERERVPGARFHARFGPRCGDPVTASRQGS